MTDRVEQLARQAEAAYIPRYDMWQMDTETLKQFAELIVNECIQAVDNVGGFNEEFHMLAIKEHFGVEE